MADARGQGPRPAGEWRRRRSERRAVETAPPRHPVVEGAQPSSRRVVGILLGHGSPDHTVGCCRLARARAVARQLEDELHESLSSDRAPGPAPPRAGDRRRRANDLRPLRASVRSRERRAPGGGRARDPGGPRGRRRPGAGRSRGCFGRGPHQPHGPSGPDRRAHAHRAASG